MENILGCNHRIDLKYKYFGDIAILLYSEGFKVWQLSYHAKQLEKREVVIESVNGMKNE